MNVLITGGSSGLGKALVERFANDNNNKVYFTYCQNENAAKEITDYFFNTVSIHVDYCDSSSVDEFITKIRNLDIHVLINNAYVGKPLGKHIHKTSIDEFASAFDNNVLPLIKVTQECLSQMRIHEFGKIINIITSAVIDVPPMGYAVYASTKGYIRQFSKSISREYAKYNITSNCILPDYMLTKFSKMPKFQLEEMQDAHPLKQLLKPEEVADIIYNITGMSQQLNGAEIPVNSAQHIM